MSWLRDDDDMLDHEKWRRALRDGGDGALLVWARLRAWCSRRLTDGVIPADMVDSVAEIGRSKSRSRALQALVAHSLCAWREDGALTICGYLERNPSRARVLEERDRRSEAQRKRRLGAVVTGHAPTTEPDRNEVPSRPVPSRPLTLSEESESARSPDVPEVPGLQRVGQSRTHTMPSAEPPKAYLDLAVMRGVSREQAVATWEHYWTTGLPRDGVEKLHPWLAKQAKERTNQLAKAPQSGPRASSTPEVETTSAATVFSATGDHKTFCAEHQLDLAFAVGLYRKGTRPAALGTVRAWDDFMHRLKHWVAVGTFTADGPLPKASPRTRAQGVSP